MYFNYIDTLCFLSIKLIFTIIKIIKIYIDVTCNRSRVNDFEALFKKNELNNYAHISSRDMST